MRSRQRLPGDVPDRYGDSRAAIVLPLAPLPLSLSLSDPSINAPFSRYRA